MASTGPDVKPQPTLGPVRKTANNIGSGYYTNPSMHDLLCKNLRQWYQKKVM